MKTLFTCMFMAACSLFAQNYDLNNYHYRFQKWQAMGLNFSLDAYHTQRANSYELTRPGVNQQDSLISKFDHDENSHGFNMIMPLFFNRFINTERLQQGQDLIYNLELDKSKYTGGNINLIARQNLYYNIYNRIYRGRTFTEINFNTNNSYNIQDDQYPADPNTPFHVARSKQFNLNNSYTLSVGKGIGRMEYVTDAVSAVFLLRDLKAKAGTGNFTDEQVEKVARGITLINNTRFLDFRYKLIDQLTMLDSVLKEAGITGTNAIRYFTTINDNWLYAQRFGRYSGNVWTLSLAHSGSRSVYEYRGYVDDGSRSDRNYSYDRSGYLSLVLNYSSSRQLGLFVQRRYGFSLNAGPDFNTSGSSPSMSKTKQDMMMYNFNANWSYLFQPNTRTYFTAGINGGVHMQNDLNGLRVSNPGQNKENSVRYSVGGSIQFFRFISPRLYYNSSISSSYTSSRDNRHTNNVMSVDYRQNDMSIPFSFQMGLTYLLF